MSKAGIERLIQNAKRHFPINDDQQVADFRARQHFFPSALPSGRGATSPLDGRAVEGKSQASKAPNLEPIPKVVESDESFVIRYAAPESSTGGCRDVET
jgi:hypothetical protein